MLRLVPSCCKRAQVSGITQPSHVATQLALVTSAHAASGLAISGIAFALEFGRLTKLRN